MARRATTNFTADYGELAPQDVNRFGVGEEVAIYGGNFKKWENFWVKHVRCWFRHQTAYYQLRFPSYYGDDHEVLVRRHSSGQVRVHVNGVEWFPPPPPPAPKPPPALTPRQELRRAQEEQQRVLAEEKRQRIEAARERLQLHKIGHAIVTPQ